MRALIKPIAAFVDVGREPRGRRLMRALIKPRAAFVDVGRALGGTG